MDILSTIIAHKRFEIAGMKAAVPLEELSTTGFKHTPVSMKRSLAGSRSGIIAEFKRRSPSKGWLHRAARVADVVPVYEACGAAACSVLVDKSFFGGSPDDLAEARSLVKIPLLYKEFIIDEYQILQARAVGADAVLLIASVLTPAEVEKFTDAAHSLQMEVLLEIHSEAELCHLNPAVDMLGVNNRNLGSFVTDTYNSVRLAAAVKSVASGYDTRPLLVSESGIGSPEDMLPLREAGYRGFLIGEAFMRSGDTAGVLHAFTK